MVSCWMNANLFTKHTGYPFTRDGQRLIINPANHIYSADYRNPSAESDMLTALMNWIDASASSYHFASCLQIGGIME